MKPCNYFEAMVASMSAMERGTTESTSQPVAVTSTSSSMRTPPMPMNCSEHEGDREEMEDWSTWHLLDAVPHKEGSVLGVVERRLQNLQ